MNKMMQDLGLVRYATPEEVATFEKVDAILDKVSDDFYDDIVVAISNHVFWSGTRKYYQRIWRYAHKLEVTPKELILWYCVESES